MSLHRDLIKTQFPPSAQLRFAAPALILAALVVTACAPLASDTAPATNRRSTDTTTPQCSLNDPAPVAAAPSAAPGRPVLPSGVTAIKSDHIHNLFRVGPKLISGAVPEDAASFDELQAMGVKTILSVDGAAPDVAAAECRGMRYVHIPITYAQATKAQQLEIARAVRDLPGPIYVHCHHGKHRGPAAAASAAVLLGELTSEQGVAFLKSAGTAANYAGLYACVAAAITASPADLDAAPATFPSTRAAAGITAAMVSIDEAYEHLGMIRKSGWTVPIAHPDLLPASEAGQLADHLRFGGEDSRTKAWGERFETMLRKAIGDATALEDGLVAGKDADSLEALWTPVVASCKDCHAAFRDTPR